MSEQRNYIEEAQQEAELRFGRQLSPEELADKFAGHDLDTRVYHLKSIRDDGELTLSEAVKLSEYVGALNRKHEALRKAGR